MYEIDFLPVENEDQDGGRSGDAIAMRFTVDGENRKAVVVIDGGFTDIGSNLVEHIQTCYKTNHVDLVISTHPDADHLNGLRTVLEELNVYELMVHQPRLHISNVSDFSNLEALDELLDIAKAREVPVTEPFTGTTRFGDQLLVLGPTEDYYVELLEEQLSPRARVVAALQRALAATRLSRGAYNLTEDALDFLPAETLTDEGETKPRNNSSVITLIRADDRFFMLTGDAGIPALEKAADYYEEQFGSFSIQPLWFFQAPHHGSRHNVGPTILNRILDEPAATQANSYVSFISSAKASERHPSPKVVNALTRRGCSVLATEGVGICHYSVDVPPRWGWTHAEPLPPLDEDDGDD